MLQPFSSLLSLLCKRQPPKCLPPGKSLSKLSRTKSLPRRRPLSLLLKPLPSFSSFFFLVNPQKISLLLSQAFFFLLLSPVSRPKIIIPSKLSGILSLSLSQKQLYCFLSQTSLFYLSNVFSSKYLYFSTPFAPPTVSAENSHLQETLPL